MSNSRIYAVRDNVAYGDIGGYSFEIEFCPSKKEIYAERYFYNCEHYWRQYELPYTWWNIKKRLKRTAARMMCDHFDTMFWFKRKPD